jgi:hypothetical protein
MGGRARVAERDVRTNSGRASEHLEPCRDLQFRCSGSTKDAPHFDLCAKRPVVHHPHALNFSGQEAAIDVDPVPRLRLVNRLSSARRHRRQRKRPSGHHLEDCPAGVDPY